MDQSFTLKELVKLYKEIEVSFLGVKEVDFKNQLQKITEEIARGAFSFDFIESEGNVILTKNNLAQKVILRKLNDNIKRIYKDEQANRRIIISQIKTLINEECPFWILKTDIKSFYNTINRDRILARLKEDAMLSYHSQYLLRQIFTNPIIAPTQGLPRGLNISSTLSEYYMRKFDSWAQQFQGVYYYARFVDDIIIFTNSKKSAVDIETLLNPKLEELSPGLEKNVDKTRIYEGQALNKKNPLNYLGYKFYRDYQNVVHINTVREQKIIRQLAYTIEGTTALNEFTEVMSLVSYTTEEQKVKSKMLQVGIADIKIKKIKSRIVKSFLSFLFTKDFSLLEDRIKFLSANYTIRKSTEGNELRAGIYYNYVEINNFEDLIALNSFLRKILYSKRTNFGKKLDMSLSNRQKDILKKYCFISGFENKIYNSFTRDRMNNIVDCW